jgi:hypothetical protein
MLLQVRIIGFWQIAIMMRRIRELAVLFEPQNIEQGILNVEVMLNW